MKNSFELKSIKDLKIDREYTAKSLSALVTLDKDAEVSISVRGLNKLRKISKLSEIESMSDAFTTVSEVLNIKPGDNVDWSLILGKEKTREHLLKIKDQIDFSKKLVTSYYTGSVYKRRVALYKNLEPVMLDGEVLAHPVYDHCTTTGRTRIIDGYNFLTMSKQKRNKLKHPDPNMILVELDLKSCEPTFYLKALGKEIDTADVYEDIASKIGISIDDRPRFKRGILSVMYGARDRTSKNILKCSFKDLEKIKKYFEIERFKSELSNSFEKNSVIYNYYGRPICYNDSLVNYWIQSSAVDYCSLAFSNLVKEMSLKPCFFVHDSITFAVESNRIEEIMSIKSVIDEYSGIEIPVEVSIPSR